MSGAAQHVMTASRPGARTVQAFDTGRLTANETFLRGEGFASLLRPVRLCAFPALAYLIEHPEGLILVDTGLAADTPPPRRLRAFPPVAETGPEQEIGPRLRAAGYDPADVRRVVLTHLDTDHAGGLRHVPRAEVLVHRPELAFARTRIGRLRYRPSIWPAAFAPTVYDLAPEPYGPFPASLPVTEAGDVRIVPMPGHSPGQVGVVYEHDGVTVLFAADHMLREDWFVEDAAAGRLIMLGAFAKRDARTTSRRVVELLRGRPTVLLPAHDAAAPDRLARRAVTTV